MVASGSIRALAAGLTLWACGAVVAQPQTVDHVPDLRAWLMRIQQAADTRNYQGTLVVSSVGAVSSSRVAHFYEAGQQFERVEALDGQMRSVVRENDTVHTIWPRQRLAIVEQHRSGVSFPALSLPGSGDAPVLENYELHAVGRDRVAGRETDVLWLKARDDLRFDQRFWADRSSGLLLRADVLSPNGQVLESSAFSDLVIGLKPPVDRLRAALRGTEGFKIVRPVATPTGLVAEGWVMAEAAPKGFRLVGCVRRALEPTADVSAVGVLQSTFSDGLTHVSLFIERFQNQKEHTRAMGATNAMMKRHGEYWITVVGDVPMVTLEKFSAALQRKP